MSKSEVGNSEGGPPVIETTSIFQLLDIVGVGMEIKANEAFTWWGIFVSKNKILVMVISFVIAIVFTAGMSQMIITTDPVELWAGPNSRSRIEKDFFDSNFRPFYRTEMVIIKAKNLDTVRISEQMIIITWKDGTRYQSIVLIINHRLSFRSVIPTSWTLTENLVPFLMILTS